MSPFCVCGVCDDCDAHCRDIRDARRDLHACVHSREWRDSHDDGGGDGDVDHSDVRRELSGARVRTLLNDHVHYAC